MKMFEINQIISITLIVEENGNKDHKFELMTIYK